MCSFVAEFSNRSVNMDATTISFDFESNAPPMEQSQSSLMQPCSQPSINSIPDASMSTVPYFSNDPQADEPYIWNPELQLFPSDDIMPTVSYFYIQNGPQAGEPFIGTPEPSLSPSVLGNSYNQNNQIIYEPESPVCVEDNMSCDVDPPLLLASTTNVAAT